MGKNGLRLLVRHEITEIFKLDFGKSTAKVFNCVVGARVAKSNEGDVAIFTGKFYFAKARYFIVDKKDGRGGMGNKREELKERVAFMGAGAIEYASAEEDSSAILKEDLLLGRGVARKINTD